MKASICRVFSSLGALAGVVLALAAIAAAPASASSAGLDRSYGQGGVAALALPASAGFAAISQIAPAPDGSAYALGVRRTCGTTACEETGTLYRFDANGTLDGAFGGTGAVVLPVGRFGYRLAVDPAGRALVAALGTSTVDVRRFATDGALDGGFATSTLPCECADSEVTLEPAPRGRTLVVVQRFAAPQHEGGNAHISLFRLLGDGLPDPGFGGSGAVGIGIGARGPATSVALTRKGAILLAAVDCCSGSRPYVLRVSAAGKLDTRFGTLAGRSLRRLSKLGEFPELKTLVPRPNGTLDLVGSVPGGHGFDLRLRGDGRLARFGRNGLVGLPFAIEGAVLGGGAIFAVGSGGSEGGYRAFRILGNGTLDPHFGGRSGIEVPVEGSGVGVASLSGGRAVVTDLGQHECRYSCTVTPAIARFLEGAKRH
jgi:hypothetical protein